MRCGCNRLLFCEAERRKSLGPVNRHAPANASATLLVIGFLVSACSGASTRSLGPDTWRVRCKSSMATCAAKADEVCSDRGYVVISGRSEKQIYGPEGQQVADERGELVVRCGSERTDAPARWATHRASRSKSSRATRAEGLYARRNPNVRWSRGLPRWTGLQERWFRVRSLRLRFIRSPDAPWGA